MPSCSGLGVHSAPPLPQLIGYESTNCIKPGIAKRLVASYTSRESAASSATRLVTDQRKGSLSLSKAVLALILEEQENLLLIYFGFLGIHLYLD